jgi:probable F420-dependent oxidoreductase
VPTFGLTAFCTDRSADPASVAVAAEAAGFSMLWFPDHTHIPVARRSPFPGGGELPEHYKRTHDPLVACAFAAAATSELLVGVGVCVVPARDPIVLAKQVASLDVLAGGRFVLGVGAGWNAEEVEDHGVLAAERWAVLDERVRAMQAIWSDDEASFDGRHVAFEPMWSWPKPFRRPDRHWPPIVVAGHGDAVLRRVVALGDEWLAMAAPGCPPLAQRMAQLHALADEAGRPAPNVSVQVYGDPPEHRIIERYVAAGVDRIDLALPHADPKEMVDAVGRLGQAVAPWAAG